MECPTCHRETRQGVVFCIGCGARLPSMCPSCGTPSMTTDVFCGCCGNPLDAVKGADSEGPVNGNATEQAVADEPIYLPVSLTKFALLSILTFNLYHIYWFGENWRFEAHRTGERIRPALRGVFVPWFCNSLLKRINQRAAELNIRPLYPSVPLTIAYISLLITANAGIPWWLISALAFVPLLPFQATVNRINDMEAPEASRYAGFTVGSGVLVGVGSVLYALAVIGTLVN